MDVRLSRQRRWEINAICAIFVPVDG